MEQFSLEKYFANPSRKLVTEKAKEREGNIAIAKVEWED